MPSYIVTDPNTGVRLKMTGDSPPSGQDIQDAFREHYLAGSRPTGESLTPPQLPETVTPPVEPPGAVARFVSGVGQNLNPFVIAENVMQLAGHPVETLKTNYEQNRAEAARLRRQEPAFIQSGPVRVDFNGHALAHDLAAVLPPFNMVTHAADQLRAGNVAGGLGEATGAAALAKVPAVARSKPVTAAINSGVVPAAAGYAVGTALGHGTAGGVLGYLARDLAKVAVNPAALGATATAATAAAAVSRPYEEVLSQIQRMSRDEARNRWQETQTSINDNPNLTPLQKQQLRGELAWVTLGGARLTPAASKRLADPNLSNDEMRDILGIKDRGFTAPKTEDEFNKQVRQGVIDKMKSGSK